MYLHKQKLSFEEFKTSFLNSIISEKDQFNLSSSLKIQKDHLNDQDLDNDLDWEILESDQKIPKYDSFSNINNNNNNSIKSNGNSNSNKQNAMRSKWLEFNKITEITNSKPKYQEEQPQKEKEKTNSNVDRSTSKKDKTPSSSTNTKTQETKKNEITSLDNENKNTNSISPRSISPRKQIDVSVPSWLNPPNVTYKRTFNVYSPVILERDNDLVEQGNRGTLFFIFIF